MQHGDVVMVGRGAQAYLGKREAALHAFIVAPRETRVTAAVERLGMERAEAERCVDSIDEQRRRYVKRHYGRLWESPDNYPGVRR